MRRIGCMLAAVLALSGCGQQMQEQESIPVISLSVSDINTVSQEKAAVSDNIVSANQIEISENTVSEDTVSAESVKVKGIYVTGPMAGISNMDHLIDLVDQTELNAMVIDIKNDEGYVTCHLPSETVSEIGSEKLYIKDIKGLVQKLKEKDIYAIGRIVAFKDPYLAEHKPEWSVKTKDGEIFRDKGGLAWVNPYQHEVWDYLIELGQETADLGFDEVQFDYIRFSTDLGMNQVDFGENAKIYSKTEIISEFTKYAYEQLKPYGVKVSADVFGTIMDHSRDAAIVGQNYEEMRESLDSICPMIYPSHYVAGAYGLKIPDADPYNTIYRSLLCGRNTVSGDFVNKTSGNEISGNKVIWSQVSWDEMRERTASQNEADEEAGKAVVRPWLQDFTASWVPGHITYGPDQVREQIQAVYDAGYEEWILWNAANRYTEAALLPEETVSENGE